MDNKNNILSKDPELGDEGIKLRLGDDEIVRVKVGKGKIDEESLEVFKENYKEIAGRLIAKPRLSVDISLTPYIPSAMFRKKAANFIKDIFKDPGFEKIAIWGGGVTQGTLTFLVFTIAGLKDTKYFKTEEEALKWLKE